MSAEAKKIEVVTVELETKPGALAKVYDAFREADVNVHASWGYQMGPDQAQAHFYAADVGKAKAAVSKLGLSPKVEPAVYATDTDEVGRYGDLLRKIADAGVNIEATDAFGIGGKYATVFFAAEKDMPALCKALGC